ncbi:MAG: hypothetical protein ACLFUJ_10005 [Phycisphaerae bacterium]
MYGMFGAIRAQQAATSAESAAARSKARADSVGLEIRALEEKVDKLTLVCMSMWSLLLERTDLTEQDLMQRVKDIDLIDGTEDGKVTKSVQKCAQCGRTMSPRHNKCLYCGASELKLSAFDDVS